MPFVTLGGGAHDALTGVASDQHHVEAHDLDTHAVRAHADLSDAPADVHHDQAHQASHLSGGADAIANLALIAVGTYTGNGGTAQSVTGIGFQVVYVQIQQRLTTDGFGIDNDGLSFSSTTIIDDLAAGAGWFHQDAGPITLRDNRIITFGSDGFTVDDDGSDLDPNKNGIVYNFVALG